MLLAHLNNDLFLLTKQKIWQKTTCAVAAERSTCVLWLDFIDVVLHDQWRCLNHFFPIGYLTATIFKLVTQTKNMFHSNCINRVSSGTRVKDLARTLCSHWYSASHPKCVLEIVFMSYPPELFTSSDTKYHPSSPYCVRVAGSEVLFKIKLCIAWIL